MSQLVALRVVAFRPISNEQWCGDAEGQEEALQGRLVEFAENKWGNKAFMVMMPSIICDPGFELCQPEHAVGTVSAAQSSVVPGRGGATFFVVYLVVVHAIIMM